MKSFIDRHLNKSSAKPTSDHSDIVTESIVPKKRQLWVIPIALFLILCIAFIIDYSTRQRKNEIATAKFEALFGISREEAEVLMDISSNIYVNGYADSLEEAREAVINTKSYFRDLSDEEMETVAGSASIMADHYEIDLNFFVKTISRLSVLFDEDAITVMDSVLWLVDQYPDSPSPLILAIIDEHASTFQKTGFSLEEYVSILASTSGDDLFQ